MTYKIYFSNAGVPATGLTPAWNSLKKVSDGLDYTPQPSISAIGGGWYKFTVSPSEDLIGAIDGGAALGNTDRYVAVDMTANDGNLDAAVSSRASQTSADAVKAKTDNLPADPASNTQVNTRLASSDYATPDNAGITAIKAKTDTLPTASQVDSQLSAAHGSGAWGGASSVALPVMQGSVYSVTAMESRDVRIVRGDTPRVYFDIGADYTGWTIKFAAKANLSDTAYAIAVKDGAWTDASKGQGYVDLTSAETAASGVLIGELELRSGTQRLTAMRFKLVIMGAVID